jgi:aminoglycoside N3'-acetyltransferase
MQKVFSDIRTARIGVVHLLLDIRSTVSRKDSNSVSPSVISCDNQAYAQNHRPVAVPVVGKIIEVVVIHSTCLEVRSPRRRSVCR